MDDGFLQAVENLSRFHREHEKFYAQRPRAQAVELQRHARALSALADRWGRVAPAPREALNPFEGCEDLNAPDAVALDGILFMEGGDEPAEIAQLRDDLRAVAAASIETGEWLAAAMQETWSVAIALTAYPELSDLLGERHRVILNDWQAASMSSLAGRALDRAADLLDVVDFTPAGLRADLAALRRTPSLVHSAVELIDRAADLLSDSAGLVHDNERRWRVFRRRVDSLLDA